jgi:exopolysaccharide production protein ExoQ
MWKRLEEIFIVGALLFCAGAFIPLLNQDSQSSDKKAPNSVIAATQKELNLESSDPTKVNSALLLGQLFVYAVIAVLLLRHRRQILFLMSKTKLLWAIIGLAILSVLWSDVPGFALRRCVNLVATSGFGLYLAYRYPPKQLLRVLGWVLIVSVVGSVIVALVRPDLGVDSALTDHAWKGIFGQKNTLGRLMAFGVMVFLFLAVDTKEHRRAYVALAFLCGGMIFASNSVTSVLVVPILLSSMWLFTLTRKRSFWFVFTSAFFVLLGAACCLMLFVDLNDLLGAIGRDATMSGRLEIWSAVLPKIMDHPWLGYGYSSFWLGMESQYSADLWSMLKWHVPHSHNGFLDLTEELGLVGLSIFLITFVVSMKRGLQWARSQNSLVGLWPIAYMSFMFLFNLTEGSILRQDNIFWVLYVATFVYVVNETKEPLWSHVRSQGAAVPIRAQYASIGSAKNSMGLPL